MHERRLRRKRKEIKLPHLAHFHVPDKVEPAGVRLHLMEDEELLQAEIDHMPSYLSCVLLG